MPTDYHSFVIPVYNEEQGVHELYRRLTESIGKDLTARKEDYEFIFVDDGSSDRSREMLRELHERDPKHNRLIALSRNFGHQLAITAGLDYAQGDTVTVLDADLQDPPEVVLEMIQKWREGFDVVYGRRQKRKAETFFKLVTAKIFYRILKKSTRLDIPMDTGDFRLMSRKAVEGLQSMREKHRFVRGMAKWVGFNQTFVTYVREARFAGETKYPFSKMFRLAWDAFTGFSLMPLQLATYFGLCAAVLSGGVGVWALYQRLVTGEVVQGWASLMIAVLFMGGVQLFTIGILGEYVGRVFEESKRRPLYLVQEVLGTGAPRRQPTE
jgi:polyisoprenyl-phosphate glycosyltransferase